MKEREQLWKLIDGLINNQIDIITFCRNFTKIYDLEIDYDELSQKEEAAFDELCTIAARFSEFEDDLIQYPNVYYSESDVRAAAEKTAAKIRGQ